MPSEIQPPRKKLIEVSMPLEAINTASAREKSIRHGHPSTLHLWWARRPLAACRAVLFGQLVDDPSSWEDRFPTQEAQDRERERLHDVIREFVEWPKSTAADKARWERALDAGRYEIARSVAWGRGEEPPRERAAVLTYLADHAAPVYDPFCGGGSIPLEAQRLGLRAYGSDLNPVAVLISKALVEIPPKFAGMAPVHPGIDRELLGRAWRGAQGLAADVRHYGAWMRDQAKARIGRLYPEATLPDGRKATVIAWLWARTVQCANPGCRRETPLLSSFVLSAKKGAECYVVPSRPGAPLSFGVSNVPPPGFEDPASGLKRGMSGIFQCLHCGYTTQRDYVAEQGVLGKLGSVLTAVVAEGNRGRVYLPPECAPLPVDLPSADVAGLQVPLASNPRDVWCRNFGLLTPADLFTPRQLVALTTFSDLVGEARGKALRDAEATFRTRGLPLDTAPLTDGGRGPEAYADALATYLAFAVSKATTRNCSLAIWEPGMGRLAGALGRQVIPIQWSFAETNPLSGAGGDIAGTAASVAENLDNLGFGLEAPIFQVVAQENNYPVSPIIVSTDPPYYDNIGYADLSDFFYVWLRRSLGEVWPALFRRLQTPKQEELVAMSYRFGGKEAAEAHFMSGMSRALTAMRDASEPAAPMAIYYAFKQSDKAKDGVSSPGWASFLQAVINAGLIVDGTWPMRLEATNALKKNVNALASCIVLSCRARSTGVPSATRASFVAELRRELPEALARMRLAGLHPVDVPQSALGPGMAVFSKYAVVREPDDSPMSVGRAIALINQVRGESDDAEIGALDPETRFALDWFASFGWGERDSGEAIKLGQSYDLAERQLRDAGVLVAERGKARLRPRTEMAADWRPSTDRTLTAWELAQALNRALHDGGVRAAGELLAEAQSLAADACWLASRLFRLAEDRRMTDEALGWGNLAGAWGEIETAANGSASSGGVTQPELSL